MGMIKLFNAIKYRFSYVYRNLIYPRLLTRKYQDILAKNLEIKNKYLGQRCFILGSGPSIKDLDLDQLKNERVFVVNEFDRHPQFKNLRHVYHVLADACYFIDDKNTYFWERLKHKSDITNSAVTYFFHVKGKVLVEKEKLFSKNKIHYLSSHGIISDHFDFNINLDKTLPWPKNSILSCLMIAVYMGFREIYLLGCEHNFLVLNAGIERGQPKTLNHFFVNAELEQMKEMNKEEAEEKIKTRFGHWEGHEDFTYESKLAQILRLFKNYRLFYKKVRKLYPDIKIFNATPNSYLDVFPSIKYEELLKKLNLTHSNFKAVIAKPQSN